MTKGKEIKILDKGFVKLVDYMGNDELVVSAARVSYNFKGKREDHKLIDFLIRNEHMTPFEMVEFVFLVKVPIFVARQIFRHRTASFNEISGRYVQLSDEFFIPQKLRKNKSANKQVSEEENFANEGELIKEIEDTYNYIYEKYTHLLEQGVAREIARIILPLGTYTMFYFKQDLRNLFNFIRLRTAPDAQKEVREVANAISSIVKEIVPISFAAFEKHILNSVKLSPEDMKYIKIEKTFDPDSATQKEELENKLAKLRGSST